MPYRMVSQQTFRRKDGHKYPGTAARFYQFRADQEKRLLSGVAMRYGDTAKFPWGAKERFAPGAFGDVEAADVLLNVQHERSVPIGRTGGGGLTLRDTHEELRVEAILPEGVTAADEALVLVRERILRGFSIEFVPEEWREITVENTVVVERAKLRAIAVVDRPQYEHSKIDRRAKMDEATLAAIGKVVEEQLEKRDQAGGDIDSGALAKGIAEGLTETVTGIVSDQVRAQVKTALDERDAEAEKRQEGRGRRQGRREARRGREGQGRRGRPRTGRAHRDAASSARLQGRTPGEDQPRDHGPCRRRRDRERGEEVRGLPARQTGGHPRTTRRRRRRHAVSVVVQGQGRAVVRPQRGRWT